MMMDLFLQYLYLELQSENLPRNLPVKRKVTENMDTYFSIENERK